MKKIPQLLIIIASFNVISCFTMRYYDTESRYPDESEHFNIKMWALDMDKTRGDTFFMLQLENKLKKATLGKNITIEELTIKTKNITYDMRYYIYEISFLENLGDWHNITNQEMTNFYDTGTINFPVQTDKMYFSYCMIYGLNPGIHYSKIPWATVSLKMKIEFEDGTTEQIAIEKYGKKVFFSVPRFLFWFGTA